MQQQMSNHKISVTWRGKKFILEMNSAATVKDLAYELQKLTDVKADTMRLIVPQASDKSSKLLSPFSEGHSRLSLQETYVFKGKSLMMMGVPKDEVDELLENAKANLRIAGFEEEESRLRQRMLERPHSSLKLPQGKYIFCEFRTLHLPGVELGPPASEALRRMHMLAADPGIVAIMNKHRWRVGIMTEMAPVGYVGVSPKCILGFNTNHGEEISLRLRTDDLKGFRKYQRVKNTLLHELAHMVYSEHDANFFALNKQLNQEAAALDWTRSKGHTLTGVRHSANYEEVLDDSHATSSKKLGGKTHDQLANARATSVAAAYRRLANASPVDKDHDREDFGFGVHQEPESMDVVEIEKRNIENSDYGLWSDDNEPDPDDYLNSPYKIEHDPDDLDGGEAVDTEAYSESAECIISSEPDPDDSQMTQFLPPVTEREIARCKPHDEPDPDDSEASNKTVDEPDPDDSKEEQKETGGGNIARSDQDGIGAIHNTEIQIQLNRDDKDLDPDDEPYLDDQELQRIQDPVTIICTRLKRAIEMLQSEVGPTEIARVLQTLFRIIRNLIEHPSEMKFKRIRKDNPVIQRNVANYKAAMEILSLVGFNEDVMLDEIGRAETYLVLKRNDPGLLWLAKSSLDSRHALLTRVGVPLREESRQS